jgi:formate dehydrogenase iron-sulfur subunit
VLDNIIAGQDTERQIALLRDLCDTMVNGSLCAMGGMTPYPVISALNHYPEDFQKGFDHAGRRSSQKPTAVA